MKKRMFCLKGIAGAFWFDLNRVQYAHKIDALILVVVDGVSEPFRITAEADRQRFEAAMARLEVNR